MAEKIHHHPESLLIRIPERFRYLIDDPEARFRLRREFYRKFGRDTHVVSKIWRWILKIITGNEGLGRSELDFMKWELRRGVLNDPGHAKLKGSQWWRDVNLEFIIIAQTAAEIHEGKLPQHEISSEIRHWLNFFEERTGQSWYRAHNSSIVRAYMNCVEQAKKESYYEQVFMNEVLYRVLFAQAMEEDDSPFKELGVIGSNPMTPAVDIMVKIPAFYPDSYPLNQKDIQYVMHKGHGIEGELEKDFDTYLIKDHLELLYSEASRWIDNEHLLKFVRSNRPIYPNL